MKHIVTTAAILVLALFALPAIAGSGNKVTRPPPAPKTAETHGSVTVEGRQISYDAYAGTITLRTKQGQPTEHMFYVAYMKRGVRNLADRPITFFYNGGPGSSTVWLHMGAFGPERVTTGDHSHTEPAPYKLINNEYSLLDATDEVFIDAPSTGFSRHISKRDGGAGKPSMYWGVDEDGHAFAQFITRFLTRYDRWNSPKYLFGESYGTMRSAVLARYLTMDDNVDLNGVVLLSQTLNYDISNADDPQHNPGMELAYELALPTYAATAWYHHKLPEQPKGLQAFLKQVEHFAMHGYADALNAGTTLPEQKEQQVAQQLFRYTGLPVTYWMKANLRVNGGEFEKTLLSSSDETTGRLDTRFSGPTMDPLSEEAQYDPQAAAISSAYVAAFNSYVRNTLDYQPGHMQYRPEIDLWGSKWDWQHRPPNANRPLPIAPNVMPDLAATMKYNPTMKVQLEAGYFDLATPFYAAVYAMHHLNIPRSLAGNISYHFYESGHMVYVHVPSLKRIHDNVAKFIESTHH